MAVGSGEDGEQATPTSAPWFLHPWILYSGDTAAQKSQTQNMRPGRGGLILAELFPAGLLCCAGAGPPLGAWVLPVLGHMGR